MFLDKFGSKNWSSISLLDIVLYLNCYIFVSNLMVIFSKVFSFIFFLANLVPKSEILQTEIWCRGTLLYADYDFNACFFKILFLFIFFGQIRLQNLKFFKLTEISCRVTLLYAYYYFNVYFFKFFAIHIILGKFGFKI